MLGGLIGHTILYQKEERNKQEVGVGCKAQEPPSSNPHPKDAPLSNHSLPEQHHQVGTKGPMEE